MNRRIFRSLWLLLTLVLAGAPALRAFQAEASPSVSSARELRPGDVAASPEQPPENAANPAPPGPPPDARARPLLEEILRRPEFSSVRKSSPLDDARLWLTRKFIELLSKLFGRIAGYPMAGSILFWLLIFGAAVWLAFLLFRYWNRRARTDELPPLDQVLLVRTWQEWIGLAREAAARGDFREAIHCVYWSGIARLVGRGLLPSGRTYTPREYLRLFSHSPEALLPPPDLPAQRQSLALLTARLEAVWYGRGNADAGDFHSTLRQAEELGCRLE